MIHGILFEFKTEEERDRALNQLKEKLPELYNMAYLNWIARPPIDELIEEENEKEEL